MSFKDYNKHIKIRHVTGSKIIFICDVCGKQVYASGLKAHIPDIFYGCPVCKESYKQARDVKLCMSKHENINVMIVIKLSFIRLV